MTHGFEKIKSLVMRELADVLAEARDPRLGFLTLMDIDLSPDLHSAKVYISVLDDEDEMATLDTLEAHSGHFRSELAKRLRLKRTPELRFEIDQMEKQARRMDMLYREMEAKDPLGEPATGDQ